MSYRIKIYIQYHYVYYIYTLCLYLIYLHLIYSHLIYSHLIYSHLIYLPFKFTSIIFQKLRRCAPHIETCQPPPTLTLGSTFYIQYRHIHITASRLFHSQPPPQAVLLHRLNLPYPIPQHTDTSQQNSHPPQPSTQKKARGVCRGAAALRPLCGFPIFAKKYCVRSPTRTKHSIFQKYFFTFCYLTTRTLYIPSISLSSSNALADAALSRSIRV